MKKIFSYIVLVVFTMIYIVSSNDYLMKKLAQYRYEVNSIWGADKYRYGDLYGFSFLPQYKIPAVKKVIKGPVQPEKKTIDFYNMCDSYIWGFTPLDSLLYGVKKYQKTRWKYGDNIIATLDTSNVNFLLIEVTERQIRSVLSDTLYVFTKIRSPEEAAADKFSEHESIIQKAERYLFNPQIDQNLEFNLFDYSFFTPVKELKASLNQRVFGRVDPEIKISRDEEFLFYAPTVDSGVNTSSFEDIDENEIRKIVTNLNSIRQHYLNMGFDHVYLSMIPNPVSVIEPEYSNYNMLIKQIQNNKDLQVPYFDIFDEIKKNPKKYYYKTDSHWNYDGFELWLNLLNKELEKINNKH